MSSSSVICLVISFFWTVHLHSFKKYLRMIFTHSFYPFFKRDSINATNMQIHWEPLFGIFYSANLCRFQSNLFLIVMLTLCRIFLHFSSNSLSFIKKDIHLVSSTFLLFALIFGNIIQKGIIIKIFKAFFTKRNLVRFYYSIHVYMI